MKEHVLYEYYTCSWETPTRCRRKATFIMDGLGYCDDHVRRVPESLRPMVRRIKYEVTR